LPLFFLRRFFASFVSRLTKKSLGAVHNSDAHFHTVIRIGSHAVTTKTDYGPSFALKAIKIASKSHEADRAAKAETAKFVASVAVAGACVGGVSV
jgi:hypothetical protein